MRAGQGGTGGHRLVPAVGEHEAGNDRSIYTGEEHHSGRCVDTGV